LAGGGICIGRNTGSAVSRAYKAPYAFTGGTIAHVTVDLSGAPYENLERELALAFSKD
jgi:arylsulfatase